MSEPVSTRRGLGRILGGIAGAIAIIFTLVVTPADASNWSGATGGTGCNAVNQTSNGYVTFYYSSLTSEMTSASDYARANALDPTDITTSLVAGTAYPDVTVLDADFSALCGFIWYASPVSPGVVGLATCNSLAGSACYQHSVYFHTPFTNGTTEANRRALASHEFGHTVGLLHRASGITSMTQGYPKASVIFDSHDISHLNAAY